LTSLVPSSKAWQSEWRRRSHNPASPCAGCGRNIGNMVRPAASAAKWILNRRTRQNSTTLVWLEPIPIGYPFQKNLVWPRVAAAGSLATAGHPESPFPRSAILTPIYWERASKTTSSGLNLFGRGGWHGC